MSTMRKLRSLLLYCLYVTVVLVAADYFIFYRSYRSYLQNIKNVHWPTSWAPMTTPLERVRHVDADVMKLLGRGRIHKKSSFVNFDKAKDEGTLRLCCLGDSYAAGDEADDGYEYPVLLAGLLEKAGGQNVEAINFAVGGFGFHQTFILWERVATQFDCDYHLLGPRGFQPIRDTTFGFTYGNQPYYLHARYILQGDEVQLIDIPGETYGERFNHHFRFFTPWRYVRYNRFPPAFLQALVPRDRQLRNPFYYDRRPMDVEAHETYEILLEKMAAQGTPIVLGHYREEIVEIARRVARRRDTFTVSRFHEEITFPYAAPFTHAGPMGNLLLARQYAMQLSGSRTPLTVLETGDVEWQRLADGASRRKLESYTRIEVELDGVAIGRFTTFDVRVSPLKVDGLLALSGLDESVLDSAFVPLDFELQAEMPVTLTIERRSQTSEYPLGALTVAGGGLNLAMLKVAGFEFLSFRDLERLKERGEPSPLTHPPRRTRGLFFRGNDQLDVTTLRSADVVTVAVDGRPALRGEVAPMGTTPGVWFVPVRGLFRAVRATSSGVVDPDALEPEGVFDLVAEHWQDGTLRVPIARWKKLRVELPAAAIEAPTSRLR